jgi:hypothetical protein
MAPVHGLVICAPATHVIAEHTRLGGLLTGLAGMIEASRLMTGQPSAGNGYELQAIAAVVIGGGSLHGGEGSVIGTLIGALIMGLLSNGSDLLGMPPYLAAGDCRRGDYSGGAGVRWLIQRIGSQLRPMMAPITMRIRDSVSIVSLFRFRITPSGNGSNVWKIWLLRDGRFPTPRPTRSPD